MEGKSVAGWFNVDIRDVLKCKSVDELDLLIYAAVHGNGLSESPARKEAHIRFGKKLRSSAKDLSDVSRISFARYFNGAGDKCMCYPENDKRLKQLAKAYYESGAEEDRQKLLDYVNADHSPELWLEPLYDMNFVFAGNGSFDAVGYYWPPEIPIEALVLKLNRLDSWGDWKCVEREHYYDTYIVNEKLGLSIAFDGQRERGLEYRELNLQTGEMCASAILDLGIRLTDEEILLEEIKKRARTFKAEPCDDKPLQLPRKIAGDFIWIEDKLYRLCLSFVTGQDVDKLKEIFAELGFADVTEKLEKAEDFAAIPGYMLATSKLFASEKEMQYYLRFRIQGIGSHEYLGDPLKLRFGNAAFIADRSVKDKHGIPACYDALAELNRRTDITVVKVKLSDNADAVYILSEKEMTCAEFFEILNACAKVKLYAIARNIFTNELMLVRKKANTKDIESFPAATNELALMQAVPDVSSDEWNNTVEKRLKKWQTIPLSLFINIKPDKAPQTEPADADQAVVSKIAAKHSGTGCKVKVGFSDGKAYFYNCYEEVCIGDSVCVGDKRADENGKVLEIAGPAVRGPYMQDVEFLVKGEAPAAAGPDAGITKEPFTAATPYVPYTSKERQEIISGKVIPEDVWYRESRKMRANCKEDLI